ncbi:hypothetical protein H2203_002654 [Taxawa tesnikishii (nom. ined.)]|nr:hypothetical protein H2203_002654 [Dothideales sp. JES 119]
MTSAALRGLYSTAEQAHHSSHRHPPHRPARSQHVNYPVSMDKYYQFSTTDMRLLTRVLSFGPTPSIPSSSAQVKNYKEATRQLIDMLPSYLRSKHNWFSSTNFCSTHKQLNPCEAALEHLFEDFKHELSTKLFETWIPLQLKGLLSLCSALF